MSSPLRPWCTLLLAVAVSCASAPRMVQVPAQQLLLDFEILEQALEKHHTGLYWYASEASYDAVFEEARAKIDGPMDEREFFNVVAPVVAHSREGHSTTRPSQRLLDAIREEIPLLPMKVWIRGESVYCTAVGSDDLVPLAGRRITAVNGVAISDILTKLRASLTLDGYSDPATDGLLQGIQFAYYYFLAYGPVETFEIDDSDGQTSYRLAATIIPRIRENILSRSRSETPPRPKKYEYRVLLGEIAYLAVHTFSTPSAASRRRYRRFLRQSFRDIESRGIESLVVDVRYNGGGMEGNENLLFSYVANNYQKYQSVRAQSNLSVLDNGVDAPVRIKTFGPFERILFNDKQADGSYERKPNRGYGLNAYRREPRGKYGGELFVLIGPATYSGGSEFANMISSQGRGRFVGEETGGGYRGNTSGYSYVLELPHSGLRVSVPALQFNMNIDGPLPLRGVLPDYEVVPTIDDVLERRDVVIEFVVHAIEHGWPEPGGKRDAQDQVPNASATGSGQR